MGMMPDPLDDFSAPDKTNARKQLGIPQEGKYIGTAGIIDQRKGVDRLIRAFSCARLPEDHRLLIAGAVQPECRETIASAITPLVNAGRAVWIDRYLEIQEIAKVTSALDLMCTPYVHHIGPSAILARSAYIGRPTLATNFGWCGAIIPRFGLGWTCNTADTDAFTRAITEHLPKAQDLVRTPLLDRWFAFLSPQNFAACWTQRIRERMDLPPGRTISWDWVQHGD
jgi:glycosyltransferase involved in cell wall biosynthesis